MSCRAWPRKRTAGQSSPLELPLEMGTRGLKAAGSLFLFAMAREGGKKAGLRTSAWVSKKAWKKLSIEAQKEFEAAMKNGIVAPKGKNGIVKLKASEAASYGNRYTHKLKSVESASGDIRIYGVRQKNGHFVFTHVVKGHKKP